MARLAVFIDGGYLKSLARDARIWVDHGRFAEEVRGRVAKSTNEPLDILRTYYYDCLPYRSKRPTDKENRRYSEARKRFRDLEDLPRYTVRQGTLKWRGVDAGGKPILQQKGVDLLLGLDFTQLCVKRQITHAAVITGDSDFLPAFNLARHEGIQVWLFYGEQSFANELRREADERVVIDEKFLRQVEK